MDDIEKKSNIRIDPQVTVTLDKIAIQLALKSVAEAIVKKKGFALSGTFSITLEGDGERYVGAVDVDYAEVVLGLKYGDLDHAATATE